MGQVNFFDYFSYLQKKSLLGILYRKYYLYPQLNSCLPGKVLDVGCGIGDFLAFRPNTIGIEVNPFNVDYCISRGLEASLVKVNEYPFETNYFDCVNMDNVLEHLDQTELIFKEIIRVLKPRGLILIGVPGEKGFKADSDHCCFYDEDKLIETMTKYRCSLIRTFHMPFKSVWMNKHASQYCIYGLFQLTG